MTDERRRRADAHEDEHALQAERRRYEANGPRRLTPPAEFAVLLDTCEELRALEPDVLVLGRPGDARSAAAKPPAAVLAVTSQRLLHGGSPVTEVALDSVEDAAVAPGRLLLILAGGQSLVLGTRRPRLLRFHVSRARADRSAAARAAIGGGQPLER